MASERDDLVRGLHEFISTLEEQGLLNSNLASAYQTKPHGSMYFLDLVLMLCNDVEAALRESFLALESSVVDYGYMFQRYLRIKEITSRMGVCALGLAIDDLPNALNTASRKWCYMALLRIRHEYHVLRPHLGTIIEDVLDSSFVYAYEMKPARGSRYFLDVVLGFCNDMEAGLRELVFTLELPVVDYEYMFEHYVKIQRRAPRLGACALAIATEELRNGIETASKIRCKFAVRRMQQEYDILRPHLSTIIELERTIIHLWANQARLGDN